jgi:hypothetical protein
MAEAAAGWQPHPEEPGAEVRTVIGLWHSVLPGVNPPLTAVLQVVLVRRTAWKSAEKKWKRDRWIQAYFSTKLSLSALQVLSEYKARWSIEITIWQARQSLGLGQDRCRRYRRIVSINLGRDRPSLSLDPGRGPGAVFGPSGRG